MMAVVRAEYRPKCAVASSVVIEHFIWTEHAERRCKQRLLGRVEVERAIRAGHSLPQINRGPADWRAHGLTGDGRRFVSCTTTLTVMIDFPPES
jgi:hypothetical protein